MAQYQFVYTSLLILTAMTSALRVRGAPFFTKYTPQDVASPAVFLWEKACVSAGILGTTSCVLHKHDLAARCRRGAEMSSHHNRSYQLSPL